MTRLTGSQYAQIQAALEEAFPTPSDLERLARFGLNVNLYTVVAQDTLRNMVFELVRHVEARGTLRDLLVTAVQQNPGNASLRAAAAIGGAAVATPVAPTPVSTPTAATRKAVVLTALPLEFRAVREQLTDLHESTHPSAGTVYDVGRLASGHGDWEVALVEVGPGNLNASLETERAIDHFGPQVVLFVGVAGGVKDVKLGDVVVATKVYGYESGKDTADGFRARPDLGMTGHALLSRARAEARQLAWAARVKGTPAPEDVEVVIGPIAAGEKVLANRESEVVRFLRENYGDTLAVEMEGHGVMRAAHQRNVNALVVRGVSDLLSGKGDADKAGWQPRAARHAAAFAAQVLAKL